MKEQEKKYEIQSYPYSPGDNRLCVKAPDEKEIYLVHTTVNGSGLDCCCLAPGESWFEGAEELVRVFETKAEMLKFLNE